MTASKKKKRPFTHKKTKIASLHDKTASLLHLAQHPRQNRPNHLLNRILVLLLVVLLLVALSMTLSMSMRRPGRYIRRTTSKIYVDSPLILLRRVLQTQLSTDLLNARLDLLHMVHRVVSLSDNPVATHPVRSAQHQRYVLIWEHLLGINLHVQVILPMTPGILNSLLQNVLGFLYKLPVQINCISFNAARRVVLLEDELRCLAIILVHFAPVRFALLAEFFGRCAIAGGVCFLGLYLFIVV